jgi:hypothetical protein
VRPSTSDGINETAINARCFPSMRKNDPPHHLSLVFKSVPTTILKSDCSCKAGSGQCSHILGLLYTLCHYQKLGLKTVPCVKSKTSMPQTWHIPQRLEGIHPEAVDDIHVQKITTAKRKRTDGVKSKFYCPIQQPIPYQSILHLFHENLNPFDTQFSTLLPPPSKIDSIETVDSKVGPVPKGSLLSYQQEIVINGEHGIINNHAFPSYPEYPLPTLEKNFNAVLSLGEQNVYDGLLISQTDSYDIEQNTIEQSKSPYWNSARKHRITSSNFKRVCSRKKDFDTLADNLLKGSKIQTAAMKFGIQHEQEAAESYASITGNNVFKAGLLINPSCFHLGTSPDRKVIDPNATPIYGLLEIKCPSADSITNLKYLTLVNNSYKLKTSHDYYYQIMGQMGLTGALWCDLYIWCRDDFHLERIHFVPEKWQEMKQKLDIFYFNYYLPKCVKY